MIFKNSLKIINTNQIQKFLKVIIYLKYLNIYIYIYLIVKTHILKLF